MIRSCAYCLLAPRISSRTSASETSANLRPLNCHIVGPARCPSGSLPWSIWVSTPPSARLTLRLVCTCAGATPSLAAVARNTRSINSANGLPVPSSSNRKWSVLMNGSIAHFQTTTSRQCTSSGARTHPDLVATDGCDSLFFLLRLALAFHLQTCPENGPRKSASGWR
jgi:hypothetical protein